MSNRKRERKDHRTRECRAEGRGVGEEQRKRVGRGRQRERDPLLHVMASPHVGCPCLLISFLKRC